MSDSCNMTHRQRFRAVMNFQPFDRLPILEWAPWWKDTLARWHAEGLPGELTDGDAIRRHFGLDVYRADGIAVNLPETPRMGHVQSEPDYEGMLSHLYPPPVIDQRKWAQWTQEQARGETVIWLGLTGFFWFPRMLFGIENHFYAFYDFPDLMKRMNRDLTDHYVRVLDELFRICTPDVVTIGEDMSYNHGPMLSKEMFAEFVAPYYRMIVPRLKAKGILVFVDSDGNITEPAAWFEGVGVDGLFPLERQSGVDVSELRTRHARMRFLGAFDKLTMNRGEAAMRAEFERLLPVAARGGLIVSCDHQTPPGVSYQDYQLYLRLFREYAQEAGRQSWLLLRS